MPEVAAATFVPFAALDEIKLHLRIEGADEDALLGVYLAAATQQILDLVADTPVPADKAPLFRVAALLAVADRYENRGGGSTSDGLPRAAAALIGPYRNLRV